jgi:ribonuclease P protein component
MGFCVRMKRPCSFARAVIQDLPVPKISQKFPPVSECIFFGLFLVFLYYSMLSRKFRIPTEKFPGVTRGKVMNNDLFRVVIYRDESLKNPKCAVIVPNKVAKTAVARNRIRRQTYDVLGEMIEKLPSSYISVFPKKVPMTKEEVTKSLYEIFK